MSDHLLSTLRITAEFLHAQGCGEAVAAVEEARRRLGHWEEDGPLCWELADNDGGRWRITSFNHLQHTANIEPMP